MFNDRVQVGAQHFLFALSGIPELYKGCHNINVRPSESGDISRVSLTDTSQTLMTELPLKLYKG